MFSAITEMVSDKVVTPWTPWKNFELATVTWVYGNHLQYLCIDIKQTGSDKILIEDFIDSEIKKSQNYEKDNNNAKPEFVGEYGGKLRYGKTCEERGYGL